MEGAGAERNDEQRHIVAGTVPQLDTVQLDTAMGAHFVDAPSPLANYRSLLDLMEQSALSPDESQKLIRSIAREL